MRNYQQLHSIMMTKAQIIQKIQNNVQYKLMRR